MCGIIGYYGPRGPAVTEMLENLLLEASRRGTHATGVAFQDDDGYLFMTNRALSAEEFLMHYDLSSMNEGTTPLRFIAHTRYSTSGPEDNQPLVDQRCAMVMNGVISQAAPKDWPMAELEPYSTTNDVEVALRYAKEGMTGEMPGSFAILELWDDGRMYAYRNGDRPLWWFDDKKGGRYIASTKDILRRVFGESCLINAIPPGFILRLDDWSEVRTFATGPDHQDYDNETDLKCPLA